MDSGAPPSDDGHRSIGRSNAPVDTPDQTLNRPHRFHAYIRKVDVLLCQWNSVVVALSAGYDPYVPPKLLHIQAVDMETADADADADGV